MCRLSWAPSCSAPTGKAACLALVSGEDRTDSRGLRGLGRGRVPRGVGKRGAREEVGKQ